MGVRTSRRKYGRMRSTLTTIARERIEILLRQARETAGKDPKLARRYVELARKISMRTKVRIPREEKHYLCKRCRLPLVLGLNSRIRLLPGNPRIVIACLSCGSVRRYPFTRAGSRKRRRSR